MLKIPRIIGTDPILQTTTKTRNQKAMISVFTAKKKDTRDCPLRKKKDQDTKEKELEVDVAAEDYESSYALIVRLF